jgi:hypothetical protein
LNQHACVLIESTRTAAHESYRGACRINTGFFTVQNKEKITLNIFKNQKINENKTQFWLQLIQK